VDDLTVPEEWRSVLGFEGRYDVSDCGRVRSLARQFLRGGSPCRVPPRILRPFYNKGYPFVSLSNGRSRKYPIHRLVLEAFSGAKPAGMEVCHNNGVRDDNRLENLRWGTHQENCDDTALHGHRVAGEAHPQSRLTETDVVEARDRYARGATIRAIALEMGVGEQTVADAIAGVSWAHVPGVVTLRGPEKTASHRQRLSESRWSVPVERRLQIAIELRAGASARGLARKYSVSESTIRRIRSVYAVS
jgi:transposase